MTILHRQRLSQPTPKSCRYFLLISKRRNIMRSIEAARLKTVARGFYCPSSSVLGPSVTGKWPMCAYDASGLPQPCYENFCSRRSTFRLYIDPSSFVQPAMLASAGMQSASGGDHDSSSAKTSRAYGVSKANSGLYDERIVAVAVIKA